MVVFMHLEPDLIKMFIFLADLLNDGANSYLFIVDCWSSWEEAELLTQ